MLSVKLAHAAIFIGVLAASMAVAATENKVVSCKTYLARGAGPSGGPALIAHIASSMTPIDLNAVLFTDKKLARSAIVEGLFGQRTPVGGLHVTARLVNCTSVALVVQARSSFMDANQLPTEAASAWKTLYLSPRSTAVYEENSIGRAEVGAYLIELRPES